MASSSSSSSSTKKGVPFMALISGGKDSLFNIAKCLAHGYELVALANLYPPTDGPEELDSFMFQSAGSTAIEALAECLDVPLFRASVSGCSGHQGLHYTPTEGDEVEDLYALIKHVQTQCPQIQAVASGAVLSTYQRTRVENVCERLGLQSFAFLWQYDQSKLLREMVEYGMEAILVKVSSAGLLPQKHLGRSIAELLPHFERLHDQYQFHVAGEGGEYETLTIDAPFFKRRLVLDETEIVIHSDDLYAPVGLLKIVACHTEQKAPPPPSSSWLEEEGFDGLPQQLRLGRIKKISSALRPRLFNTQGLHTPSPSSQRPPRLRLLPHIYRQGHQLNISGIAQSGVRRSSSPGRQTQACLGALQYALQAHGSRLEDVVYVHLYLRSMSSFNEVNITYCQAPFGNHPPSRSCVEALLPPHTEVMLDAVALVGSGSAMSLGDFKDRKVLHVKSLSSWAPLCIGPYSQANMLTSGHLVLLAGQIGLDPASMTLVKGGQFAEAIQALHNCAAVLASIGASLRTALMMIVYINVGHACPVGIEGEWEELIAEWREVCVDNAGYGCRRRHRTVTAHSAGEVMMEGEGGAQEEEEEEERDEEEATVSEDEEGEKGKTLPPSLISEAPFLVLGVPGLPKNAAVEFEVISLSSVLARHLNVETSSHTKHHHQQQQQQQHGLPPVPTAAIGEEEGGGEGGAFPPSPSAPIICPLPQPFQPPSTFNNSSSTISTGGKKKEPLPPTISSSSWISKGGEKKEKELLPPLASTCSMTFLTNVFCFAHITLALLFTFSSSTTTTTSSSFSSSAAAARVGEGGEPLEKQQGNGKDADPSLEEEEVEREKEEEEKDIMTHLNYEQIGEAIVQQIDQALVESKLAWRQLSHLRVYYVGIEGGGSLEEKCLREALAVALPSRQVGWLVGGGGEGGGGGSMQQQCAKSFIPVSVLEGRGTLVSIQMQAMDLERLRTEAWIHEVPLPRGS